MSLLRKVLMRLSRSIWQAFMNNRWERANYLKTRCGKVSNGSEAQGWYLDIGARDGINSLVFGQKFTEIVMLDVQLRQEAIALAKNHPSVHCVLGNAQSLPFRDCNFGLVTMFSTVEHLQDAESGVREASRVTRTGGQLVIQAPNSNFPLDLHTGLPNPFFFCPGFLRPALLSKLGYSWWVNDVHKAPGGKQLSGWVGRCMQLLSREKVIYPEVLIPGALRPLYKLLRRATLLNLMPLSYIYIYQKYDENAL
jgi:ubiquinone/menaquinone biosynthesis C-methylase UbiE